MEISLCREPLYSHPKPYYSKDFNRYLTLQYSVISSSQEYYLEMDPVFLFVRKGTGHLTVNGLIFPIRPGCAFLLQSYHAYRFSAITGAPLDLVAVVLDHTLLGAISYSRPIPGLIQKCMEQIPVLYSTPEVQTQFSALLARLHTVDGETSQSACLIKVAICGQIKSIFLRECSRSSLQKYPLPAAWRAWNYLVSFCTKRVTAAEVADAAGLQASQLNRELRKISGYDYRKLITRTRVGVASSMFLLSGVSMQHIARITGFPSESAFFRAFQEWRGMTPQELKEQMLSPENHCRRYTTFEKPFQILSYISNHYQENITLGDVAEKFYLGEAMVNQILTKYFDRTFHYILTEFRLLHAKGLLRCSNLPVCDIAIALGFSSAHTFTRAFKNYFHMTPGEFRKGGRVDAEIR